MTFKYKSLSLQVSLCQESAALQVIVLKQLRLFEPNLPPRCWTHSWWRELLSANLLNNVSLFMILATQTLRVSSPPCRENFWSELPRSTTMKTHEFAKALEQLAKI